MSGKLLTYYLALFYVYITDLIVDVVFIHSRDMGDIGSYLGHI